MDPDVQIDKETGLSQDKSDGFNTDHASSDIDQAVSSQEEGGSLDIAQNESHAYPPVLAETSADAFDAKEEA